MALACSSSDCWNTGDGLHAREDVVRLCRCRCRRSEAHPSFQSWTASGPRGTRATIAATVVSLVATAVAACRAAGCSPDAGALMCDFYGRASCRRTDARPKYLFRPKHRER